MLYFHGIGEDIGELQAEITYIMVNCEVNVIAVEYPGYGVHWDRGVCTEKQMIIDS